LGLDDGAICLDYFAGSGTTGHAVINLNREDSGQRRFILAEMGDYFDTVADAYELPHPPRLTRAEVKRSVSPALWSFMNESRRLLNRRMKTELQVRLRYPTVASMLSELLQKRQIR